ncbi:COPII coat assembly protein sec16 [Ophiocordyceps camponoti-floridani]|uniref:Protein transport protein sec16 n=1 Tax=Ophiocordyceps camponoti-floridani TaxID=2030778 RepID=A0A8H4Q5L9_9HYPO|nr:COPII coat assembly protein sec16 [Ophiocordyceps camponoti-floridani]
MADGPPSSSWHPALMPNSSPLSSPLSSPGNRDATDQGATELADRSWPSEEAAADDGDAWHDTGRPSDRPPNVDGEPWSQEAGQSPVDEARPLTMNSQHSSSMSFARTVSHEVNFNDEDDPEWNPTRSDAHPSPRPAQGPENNSSSAQTQNAEVDAEPSSEVYASRNSVKEAFDSMSPHPQEDNWPETEKTSQAIASEEQDMQARYEEGIPPISSESVGPTESFADDNDDDFFRQIQQSGTEDGDPLLPEMQRKSTTEAMGAHLDASDHSVSESETKDNGRHQHEEPPVQDLAAKWQAAFAGDDDDEFLVEDRATGKDSVDASAFLGSDDEGLLDDEDGLLPDDDALPEPTPAPSMRLPSAASIYTPVNVLSRQPSSPYFPTIASPLSPPVQQSISTPFAIPQQNPPRSEPPRAQSFADKPKDGYSSPYDLPPDLLSNTIKPRKRTSMQQLPSMQPAPPPRSTSMYAPGRPPAPGASPSPVQTAQGLGLNQAFSPSSLRNQSSFFEELPVAPRSRPTSRQSNLYTPTGQAPPVASFATPPVVTAPAMPQTTSPYAAATHPSAVSMPPPSTIAARYSPAPMAPQAAAPQAPTSRYSPAPTAQRFNSMPPPPAPQQPVLPHTPRTSSPLALFLASSDKLLRAGGPPDADVPHRANSFDPRLTRVSSLPPTREVDEEEDDRAIFVNRSDSMASGQADLKNYSAPLLPTLSQTQPHSAYPATTVQPLSRATTSYAPHSAQPSFMPPPPPVRAATHSPAEMRPLDPSARPSTAHALSPPAPVPLQPAYVPFTRTRGQSLTTNMMPPSDGRENDALQRWRGTPLLTWGVGGTMVTSFPRSIARYAMNQTTPTVWRTCGEVKVQNIKDILPLADRLSKFPGPLKGKSKKKEALAWLAAGIEAQERDLGQSELGPQLSLEAKRGVERLLLWKLLRVFIEFDGTLEGGAAVEKAVRDVLSPSTPNAAVTSFARSVGDGQLGPVAAAATDSVDPVAMEQIRHHLLQGNREVAVWTAVDKRLWGHAMLISHTVSPDLYKRVAQEFVRKEVNYPGHNNESMAALYKVLSGDFYDCVNELVPSHARVGLRLVSTEAASEPAKDAMEGLDKWLETLTLILYNRSADDVRALNALGKLLSDYGRAEAAQICFIFSRNVSVFGGLDDQKADFVLLGSDHRQQSDQFAKETEALQLSEVYEYGLSLAGGAAAAVGAPHLAAYKLQHAVTLAEYGYRDKALQYCDAIDAAIASQTRRSPYHHAILETALHDFMTRLRQAPRDASSSWISKPSMNKVSDSVWNHFSKFVAGDDGGGGPNGTGGEGDTGPFARVATTPNMSRSPSISNFESYGGGASPGYAANAASSRYAPATVQNVHPSTHPPSGRGSSEYPRNPYESIYGGPVSPQGPVGGGGLVSSRHPAAGLGFGPVLQETARIVPNGHGNQTPTVATPLDRVPQMLQESPHIYTQSEKPASTTHSPHQGYSPSGQTYEPPQMTSPQHEDGGGAGGGGGGGGGGGYQTPSYQPYGYEPPSYSPPEGDATRENTSPNDENERRALGQDEKSKAEKDRENEEMFRKAAEEDAKRAASKQSTKKGWGFGGWFGGGKKNESMADASPSPNTAGKPIRAKLGEASSFVFDPELKRWINKKPGAENVEVKKATPPPPRSAPRSAADGGGGGGGAPPRPVTSSGAPPFGPGRGLSAQEGPSPLGPSRSVSGSDVGAGPPSRPPSRPATSMSNASSIDDLLGTAAPRKGAQKKPRKSGRYIDVMAK